MKRERKNYDPAFKLKAVKMSNGRDNFSELARELGIKVALLYRWRKEYEELGEGDFLNKRNHKPTQERIHKLERKLKDTELERDILKRAIGIFYNSARAQ